MALIEIKDVLKTYRVMNGVQTKALRGVNLSVEEGSFVSIAGSSGSGKTTLLNIIGALDKPDEGSIIYEGRDITPIPVNQLSDFRLRKVGFIFQAYNLISTLTAIENTEYVMLLQGVNARLRRERSIDILKRVGLEEFIDRRPTQMSGGQQQRVAVARAIVSEPKVILADEPTANLDSATSMDLISLMRELNREKKITFIFSTHDEMVMSQADHVFHMKDGKFES